MRMKFLTLWLVLAASSASALAQTPTPASPAPLSGVEKELADLSRQKWLWMAGRDTKALDKLIDPQAVFVHMGATFDKTQELDVIEGGRIQYKQTDVKELSVKVIGETAIVLSRVELFALVGGNEARNPFSVTETYVKQSGEWRLVALAFTRRTN
jgi:4-carboxymuconolactone decarboxylase